MNGMTRRTDREQAEAAVLAAVRGLAGANERLREAEEALSTLTMAVQDRRSEAHRANLYLEECLEAAGAGVRTERYA